VLHVASQYRTASAARSNRREPVQSFDLEARAEKRRRKMFSRAETA